MKKTGLSIIVLLASILIFFPLAYAGQQTGAEAPGTGKAKESGMKTGYHEGEYMKGYHHQKAGVGMKSKRAEQILGKPVASEDGTSLGTLHDLVIFGKGVVHYGILALEDPKDQYVAIPFTFLESRDEEESLVLHMDAEKIQGAPKFSLQEITDWDNSEIGEKVHSYYGAGMMKGMGMDMKKGHPDYPHGKKALPGTGKAPESGMGGN